MSLSDLTALPATAKQVGAYAMATIDLDSYGSRDDLVTAARAITAKRGTINRHMARARRAGYAVRPFMPGDHLTAMVAIHRSKPFRDRKPLQGEFYNADAKTLAAMVATTNSFCPQHNETYWGIFLGATLVGYICLTRLGNTATYRHIMGHGEHLRHGIMYLLHYELAAALLADRPPGLRYLANGVFARRPLDPPSQWQTHALFTPFYLLYADDHCVSLPAEPPMPGFAEGLLTLKQTLDAPWPEAVEIGNQLSVSPAWLAALHRAWIVENTRAPGLHMNILRAGPYPPPDALAPLTSGLFPMEALAGIGSVRAVLSSDTRGLDTLLPLRARNLQPVYVEHGNEAELAALRETYPDTWTYGTATQGASADLWIIEPTDTNDIARQTKAWRGSAACRLIISLTESDFLALDCPNPTAPQVATSLGRLAAGTVTCSGIFFRHGAPEETRWVVLEKT